MQSGRENSDAAFFDMLKSVFTSIMAGNGNPASMAPVGPNIPHQGGRPQQPLNSEDLTSPARAGHLIKEFAFRMGLCQSAEDAEELGHVVTNHLETKTRGNNAPPTSDGRLNGFEAARVGHEAGKAEYERAVRRAAELEEKGRALARHLASGGDPNAFIFVPNQDSSS